MILNRHSGVTVVTHDGSQQGFGVALGIIEARYVEDDTWMIQTGLEGQFELQRSITGDL